MTIIFSRHIPLPPDAHPRVAIQRNCVLHGTDCQIVSHSVTQQGALDLLAKEPDGTLAWWPS